MKLNDYQKLAMRTINHDLDASEMLLNGCMGLCGEAGEVIDVLKKHRAQGHSLDADRIVDELGDCMWYAAEIAHALGVTLEDVAKHNIAKLAKRYPSGFDAEHSINRTA